MPRRTLNTKAAITWRKDSSQIDYQMMHKNRPYRTEATRTQRRTRRSEIRGYLYQQKSKYYLPAQKSLHHSRNKKQDPGSIIFRKNLRQMFL